MGRSTMGTMRAFKRALAMVAVTFVFASSVAYVIPNAQAVESTSSVAAADRAAAPQELEPVSSGVVAAVVARDGYGVTLPPPPPPPPPPKKVAVTLAQSRGVALVPSSSSAELQWPVPAGTKVLSNYGPRSCSGCYSSFHEGTDFGAPGGSPIWSIAPGVVVEASSGGSFGVHAVVQHVIDGQVITSLYAHMVSGSLAVSVGDSVAAGQPLGAVGCTGTCTGTHLHFEIHPGGGAAVDPMAWMSQRLG